MLAALAIWATSESRATRIADTRWFLSSRKAHFDGKVAATIVHYDRTNRIADVTFDITVTALQPGVDIDLFSFSALADDEGAGNWKTWLEPPDTQETEKPSAEELFDTDDQIFDAPGAPPRSVVGKKTTISIPIQQVRSDAWFPFDEWFMVLRPKACVEEADSGCTNPMTAVDFRMRTIMLGDSLRTEQNSVLQVAETDKRFPIRIVVRRQVFVRLLPIFFVAIACGFLYYVARYEQPREQIMKILGTIAALWGLRGILVPKQILIFPTLLDYTLLVLIAVAFIITIIKFEAKGSPS